MIITVNNKLTVLKKDTSFDYVSENRLFSGSDDYSLTISFPLRGCPENIAIFGNINRADVSAQKVEFDCEIRDRNFCKTGTLTIVEINEVEVKTQFLEGRSEQNYSDTLADVYINKLDLGKPESCSLKDFPSPYDTYNWWNYMALPYLNSNTNVISNKVKWNESGKYFEWHEDTTGISWQPNLYFITTRICEAIGYDFDFKDWKADEYYRGLYICNAVPYLWDRNQSYRNVLPHWTVEEYFAKLELLLDGEFDIDHRQKKITFRFSADVVASIREEVIEEIIDEHSVEVDTEAEENDYIYSRNLAYADAGHQMSNFYQCDYINFDTNTSVERYQTVQQIVNVTKKYATWSMADSGLPFYKYYYAEDVDMYFVLRMLYCIKDDGDPRTPDPYRCMLQPINAFGAKVFGASKDADASEIDIVPVCVDWISDDIGKIMVLPCNETPFSTERVTPINGNFAKRIKEHQESSTATAYDRIFVAYFNGYQAAATEGHVYFPYTSNCEVSTDFKKIVNTADFAKQWHSRSEFSLRLNRRGDKRFASIPRIDPKRKVTFKFLADRLPEVRAVFHIRGKRYLCSKLTATFTAESGLSHLLKGVFHPIQD